MKMFSFGYDRNGMAYCAGGYGRTAEEALEHQRFWWPDLPELEDMIATGEEETDMTEEEAYYDERILRQIYADPETYLKRVETCGACEKDKDWMRDIINSRDPQAYMFADTMVRDMVRGLTGNK